MVLGFLLGLFEALELYSYDAALKLGAVGLVISAIIALAAGLRVRAPLPARVGVTLLRTGLTAAVYIFVFIGMRLFLSVGSPAVALGLWVLAGLLGALLARLAPAGPAAGHSAPS